MRQIENAFSPFVLCFALPFIPHQRQASVKGLPSRVVRSGRAFTLVELLVVMAITAIFKEIERGFFRGRARYP
jgi:prepilin-type N-terminal cleavage/methylation domain-containing protein